MLHIKMVKKYFGELGLSFAHLEDLSFLFPSYCDTSGRGHPCPSLEPASPHGLIRVVGMGDCCPQHSAHVAGVGHPSLLGHCLFCPTATSCPCRAPVPPAPWHMKHEIAEPRSISAAGEQEISHSVYPAAASDSLPSCICQARHLSLCSITSHPPLLLCFYGNSFIK